MLRTNGYSLSLKCSGVFCAYWASILHWLTCLNLHIQFTSSNICNKMLPVTGVPLYIYQTMYVYNVWLLDPPCYYLLGSAAVCVSVCLLSARGCVQLTTGMFEPRATRKWSVPTFPVSLTTLARRGYVAVGVCACPCTCTCTLGSRVSHSLGSTNQSASAAGFPCRSICFHHFCCVGCFYFIIGGDNSSSLAASRCRLIAAGSLCHACR